jgi:predicted glycosyltransferase
MRIVFTIPAPKELYMFKVVGELLKNKGHEIYYLVRDYDSNKEIADYILNDYFTFGKKRFKKAIGKMCEIPYNAISPLSQLCRIQPDIIVGDALLGYPSKIIGVPSIAFVDGDALGVYKLIYNCLYLSDVFVIPEWNTLRLNRKKIIRYRGLQELAYLHPKYFKPDPRVLDLMGVSRKTSYVIVRLSALEMSHDIGLRSVSENQLQFMLDVLNRHFTVFISSERKLNKPFSELTLRIPRHMFHSALYYASFFISDTASAVEASLLGTPSIQISPVNRQNYPVFRNYGCFLYLNNYGLMKIVPCTDTNKILEAIMALVNNSDQHKQKQHKVAERFINDHIDVAAFFSWFIDLYPSSLKLYWKSEG